MVCTTLKMDSRLHGNDSDLSYGSWLRLYSREKRESIDPEFIDPATLTIDSRLRENDRDLSYQSGLSLYGLGQSD